MIETLIYLIAAIAFLVILFNLYAKCKINELLEQEKEQLIRDNKFFLQKNHKLSYEKETLKKLIESQETLITDFQSRLN
jgi:hypothetical protein